MPHSLASEERSTCPPADVRLTWPWDSSSGRRRARSSRSIAVVSCIWAWRVKPCRPKWSGSYLIIHLNLCLWSPAFPVPPRPPAPRPCFFPRPCVRLPRSFFVLLTIVPVLLEEHAPDELVDRLAPVPEVPAVVVSAL